MGATQSEVEKFQDPGPTVTQEMIIKAIQNYEKANEITINRMEDSNPNKKGEGFLSDIVLLNIEAVVDGNIKLYSWIVKSTSRNPQRAVMSSKFRSDERENAFYGELMPALKKFVKEEMNSELLPKFAGIVYTSWTDEHKVLVMENLKALGWKDAENKKLGLDIHHVRLALKYMATFHAVTYAFIQKYPGGIDQANKDHDIFFFKFEELFTNLKEVLEQYGEVTNEHLKKLFASFEVKDIDYTSRIEKLINENGDLYSAAIIVKDKEHFNLKTICHGDPWFNNMMFQYNENGEVDDILMIDFQLTSYACPALDLNYFLSASTTGDLRKKYMDHILTFYHTTFINTVESFCININYSFEHFIEDYNKTLLYGLSFAVEALPMICAENEDDIIDMEDWIKNMGGGDNCNKEGLKEQMDHMGSMFASNHFLGKRIRELADECISVGVL